MKYIKTFENLEPPYKKYAVWQKDKSDKYLIVNIIGPQGHTFKMDTMYHFNNEKQLFVEAKIGGSRRDKLTDIYVKKHILFSSDDIEECKEQILFLLTTNKYNL